jgi:hypothetical protein
LMVVVSKVMQTFWLLLTSLMLAGWALQASLDAIYTFRILRGICHLVQQALDVVVLSLRVFPLVLRQLSLLALSVVF